MLFTRTDLYLGFRANKELIIRILAIYFLYTTLIDWKSGVFISNQFFLQYTSKHQK